MLRGLILRVVKYNSKISNIYIITKNFGKVYEQVFYIKAAFKISQYSQENTCVGISFLIKLQALDRNFIRKETPTQVFFC